MKLIGGSGSGTCETVIGAVEAVQLDGTDHSMVQVGGMEEGHTLRDTPAYRQRMAEGFDWRIVAEVDAWIKASIQH